MKLKSMIFVSITALALGGTVATVYANAENTFSKQPLMLVANQTHQGIGTVTAIDNKARKIELKHGPIKSIGWMGMKMSFDVEDADLLDEVAVGDKVDFDFIETRDGRFVVTDIETQG